LREVRSLRARSDVEPVIVCQLMPFGGFLSYRS
jgi:hypothetical protein